MEYGILIIGQQMKLWNAFGSLMEMIRNNQSTVSTDS